MTSDELLIELFQRFEKTKQPIEVTFDDGKRYLLQIISTMHAEEGGDIVADVIECIEIPPPDLWKNSAMNFNLKDVVRVVSGYESLFTRLDD